MWALTPTAEEKPQGDQQGEGRVMVEAETGVRWSPAKGRQDCGKHKLGIPSEPVHTCILDFWFLCH